MLVVSDSSPLNFLARLRCVDVLPALFGRVLIPPVVVEELSRGATPAPVKAMAMSPPAWLEVRAPSSLVALANLDAGEVAAISLALEVRANLVLLDDGNARRAATARGLAVIGLLGILERADERSLIDLATVVEQLPADYRIDRAIVDAVLQRRRERGAARDTPAGPS